MDNSAIHDYKLKITSLSDRTQELECQIRLQNDRLQAQQFSIDQAEGNALM